MFWNILQFLSWVRIKYNASEVVFFQWPCTRIVYYCTVRLSISHLVNQSVHVLPSYTDLYLHHVFRQNTTIWNVIIKFANTSGSLWHKCKCERCSVSHLTQFQAHSSSYVTWWFFFHCIKYFDEIKIIFWLNYELCMYLVWITLYWTSELMENKNFISAK